ncbi:MAG: Slp family lipoprotein [bacterium]
MRCKALLNAGLAVVLACALGACGSVVSREFRKEAEPAVAPEALFQTPDAYQGRLVILGGEILSGRNTREATFIEVLSKPLDSRDRPKETDTTFGRFLVEYPGYLETAIYKPGREVTVAGRVLGTTKAVIDQREYTLPLIAPREIHLVESNGRWPGGVSIGIGVGAGF